MKKTVNIVLSGVLFCLEEDAYKKLNNYIEAIREKYASEKGGEEIVADIENSIAEKFTAKITAQKKTIAIEDVTELIEVMGTVADFEELETEKTTETISESTKEAEQLKIRRKLYRNSDDMIIGGVASGIAEYFEIDPTIVRVIFVLLLIFGGSGFWIYLVLWLVMPLAKTSAQKLEMRGKPVTLAKLEQVAKSLKKRAPREKTWRRIVEFPFNFLRTVTSSLGKMLRAIAPITRKMVSLILVSCALLGILFTGLLAAILLFNPDIPYFGYDFSVKEVIGAWQYNFEVLTAALVVVIPLFSIFLLGLMIWRKRNVFTTLSSSLLLAIWMLAVILLGASVVDSVPKLKKAYQVSEERAQIEKSFDYQDFKKVEVAFSGKVELKKGDNFVIKASGRDREVDQLRFTQNHDTLQIIKEYQGGFCIFCLEDRSQIIIELPELEEVVSRNMAEVSIKGFEDAELKIRALEHSTVDLMARNQQIKAIADKYSQLNLYGVAKTLDLKLTGNSSASLAEFEAEKIQLAASGYSQIELKGIKEGQFAQRSKITAVLEDRAKFFVEELSADLLELELSERAKAELAGEARELKVKSGEDTYLKAFKLDTEAVQVVAGDSASVKVKADGAMDLQATDSATIIYKGNAKITKQQQDLGSIVEFGK